MFIAAFLGAMTGTIVTLGLVHGVTLILNITETRRAIDRINKKTSENVDKIKQAIDKAREAGVQVTYENPNDIHKN